MVLAAIFKPENNFQDYPLATSVAKFFTEVSTMS